MGTALSSRSRSSAASDAQVAHRWCTFVIVASVRSSVCSSTLRAVTDVCAAYTLTQTQTHTHTPMSIRRHVFEASRNLCILAVCMQINDATQTVVCPRHRSNDNAVDDTATHTHVSILKFQPLLDYCRRIVVTT